MLPPPREPGRYRISLVCLGNICRSPMAHVVLERRLAEAGLTDRVEVSSSGTGDWHVGKPMDERAAATLAGAGYDGSAHRASSWDPGRPADLVLAMDAANLRDVGGRDERTWLFGDLDPVEPGAEVPDPYYGGPSGFEEVLRMVERTSASLVSVLEQELAAT
ncbi:low molecular weight protein-tyrosine-phosphatase [Nocardioides coralli]|uniref:low molecular weight protein-tyrosine-phosphatase n=1 Tax=Nocardioides coralli TaxID=2872154 RepID=UPI001CA3AD57|nr:low molecular weight protein-tyrosine-phosphatase [Nocardioides coralli]QZY28986.1 low molecular weight phosphotyrosine protein phosphatase [Nocardioides coralli]